MNTYNRQQLVSKFNIDNTTLDNLPELSYFEMTINNKSCLEVLIVRKEKGGLIIGKTFLSDDYYYWAPWQSDKFIDEYSIFI
jgi:hypothetical protein